MQISVVAARVKVLADGRGVLSHARMGLVRELADLKGLPSSLVQQHHETSPTRKLPSAFVVQTPDEPITGRDAMRYRGQPSAL